VGILHVEQNSIIRARKCPYALVKAVVETR
jgi:hypothetical protein